MASKTKIYFVLELVTGGELFDKIVSFFDLLNMSFFFKSSVRTWFLLLVKHWEIEGRWGEEVLSAAY